MMNEEMMVNEVANGGHDVKKMGILSLAAVGAVTVGYGAYKGIKSLVNRFKSNSDDESEIEEEE